MAALSITCHGMDGSVFNYHAVNDEVLGPGEMGWILIVKNSPTPIAPQRVSAAEVYGDLVSMTLDPPEARVMVRAGTERCAILSRARQHDCSGGCGGWGERADDRPHARGAGWTTSDPAPRLAAAGSLRCSKIVPTSFTARHHAEIHSVCRAGDLIRTIFRKRRGHIKRGVRARPKATEFVRCHAPQYITEHDDHHDRIVQLPEDRDEIRDQVNRTDQVGKEDYERRFPSSFNSRSRQEPLE